MIKLLFDGHIFPRLVNFLKDLKNAEFLDSKKEKITIGKSNYYFYHEFFSAQCGSSFFDKHNVNGIGLLNSMI